MLANIVTFSIIEIKCIFISITLKCKILTQGLYRVYKLVIMLYVNLNFDLNDEILTIMYVSDVGRKSRANIFQYFRSKT